MSRRAKRGRARAAGFVADTLEPRTMLSGYFDNVAESVAGNSGAISAVTQSMRNLGSVAEKLPLIDKPVRQITNVTDSLDQFRVKLYDALRLLSPNSAASAVQSAIFSALGPDGAKVLGDKNNSGALSADDVSVTVTGTTAVDISLDIAKSVTFGSELGLGLDSVPFKPAAGVGGGFTVGLSYRNFDFGYRNGAPYFSTAAADELKFTIAGRLPAAPFNAGLGFMDLEAKDGTPGVDDLTVSLTADVTPSFGIANARLDGQLALVINLTAAFGAIGLPKFQTDLKLNWPFPTVPLGGASAAGAAPRGVAIAANRPFGLPSLRLDNVKMNLGSMLGNLVQPIAQRVQLITEPLQPILDLVRKRIPALSDMSETFGGPQVDMVLLSNALNELGYVPDEFNNAVETADKLRQFAATVNALAGEGGSGWINIGSFAIGGPNGQSLLDAPAASLGNLGAPRWSSLVAGGAGVTFDGVKQQIRDLVGNDVGDDINEIWDQLSGEWEGNGLTVKFPVIEDTAGVALGMLLGQDADLVTVKASLYLGFDKTFNVSPIPGLIVGIHGEGHLGMHATVGYDTRGLREAIAPMYDGDSFDPTKLMHGLWIDRETGADVGGKIKLVAGVGIPDVAEFTVGGGTEGGLYVRLDNPRDLDKIRPLAGDLTDCLFRVGGKFDAFAEVEARVGISVLGEFIGLHKSWNFARATIFEFKTDCTPLPGELNPDNIVPPELAHYDAGSRILTLAAGPNAGWRNDPGLVAVHDESFTIKRVTRYGLASDVGRLGIAGVGVIYPDFNLGEVEVSAFGITQRFTAPIDHIIALMGDGNDDLHVIDASGYADYIIDAGEDDDVVTVDGRCDVYIQGGPGNDKLDGGNGKSRIDVRGGPGFNEVGVAKGKLTDLNPAAVVYLEGERLVLDNTAEKGDTDYYFQDDLNSNQWKLTVDPRAAGSPTRVINFSRMPVKLFSGPGNDVFYGYPPLLSVINGGEGDDTLQMSYYLGNMLPHTKYGFSFYGGPGNDSLPINNTAGAVGTIKLATNDFGDVFLRWGQDYDSSLSVRDIESTSIIDGPNSNVTIDGWTDGTVDIEAGSAQVNVDRQVGWTTRVHLHNTPSLFLVSTKPASYPIAMGIDENGPYAGRPGGGKLFVDYDDATTTVGFYGSNVSVEPSVALSLRPWNIQYAGTAGQQNSLRIAPADYLSPNLASPDYHYVIDGDTLRIGPLTMPTFNLTNLYLQSGQGNDVIEVTSLRAGVAARIGGGIGDDQIKIGDDGSPFGETVAGTVHWSGGPGIDSMQVNDRGATFARTYDIGSDGITNGIGGVAGRIDASTESVTFDGSFSYDNAFNIRGNYNTAWTITGGESDDAFTLSDFTDFAYSVVLDPGGGDGQDTLLLDNSREPTIFQTVLHPDRVQLGQGTAYYSGMEQIEYDGSTTTALGNGPPFDTLYVAGTPAGVPFSYFGTNQARDTVFLGSADGTTGSLANLGGPVFLSLNGQPVRTVDAVFYIDRDEPIPHVYDVESGRVLRDGVAVATVEGAEAVTLSTGQGFDTINVVKLDAGRTLAVRANEGNDAVVIPGAAFSNSTAQGLSFDGGEGFDTLVVDDRETLGGDVYVIETNGMRRNGAPIPVVDVDELSINAGPGLNIFRVSGVSDRRLQTLRGGDGNDILTFPGLTLDAVRGTVLFYGGGGDDSIRIDDSGDQQARTFHIDQDGVGAYAYDTLFGPGGGLRFYDVTRLDLTTGFGADTVFVQPNVTTQIYLQDIRSDQDTLNLVLAGANNPALSPRGASAGQYTFDNRQVVDYSGFATVATWEPTIYYRYIFYNNSQGDSFDPAPGWGDDTAIPPDKTPLLPGETATVANYSSYSKGINGVSFDVTGLPPGEPSADDLVLRVGRDGDPSQWDFAPAPSSVTVRRGAGAMGWDRVSIIWPDGAIVNQWLQVTVKATALTGLQADDVFYFGNLVGDTTVAEKPGGAADSAPADSVASVNGADLLAVRRRVARGVALENTYDINRDGRIDGWDMRAVLANRFQTLRLITAPETLAVALEPTLESTTASRNLMVDRAGILRRRLMLRGRAVALDSVNL